MKFLRSTSPLTLSVSRPGRRSHLGVGGSEMYRRVFALLLFLFTTASAITTETGKSFFTPQPISVTLAPQTSAFEEFAARHAGDERFFFAATPFFTRSNAGKNLRRYFFPEGKDELVIKGSDAGGAVPDVSGTWLKIMGNNVGVGGDEVAPLYNQFQSKISINPVYENLGVNLNFYKNITASFFIAGECAVMQSKVMHGFTEYAVQNQTTRQAVTQEIVFNDNTPVLVRQEPVSALYALNATESFTNVLWHYGKLSTTPIKKEGINDVAIKAGLNLGYGTVFAKIVLPTSQKPTAMYMFEPMTGNSSHLGLGFGGTLRLEKALHSVTVHFFNGGEYVYLLENAQRRTFDLKNGAWSRYLLMRDLGQKNSDPGVNYLTLSTKVTPGNTINWQSRLGIQLNKMLFNVGYNFYFAEDESIRLSGDNFKTRYNVAAEQLIDGAVGGVAIGLSDRLRPTAIIGSHAGTYAARGQHSNTAGSQFAVTAPIDASNIQLQSAQQPAKLVSQLGASVGFEDMCYGLPVFLKIGYAYNIDHNKTALEGWAAWAQLALKI